MNPTPNTRDVLIARTDEQFARAYEQLARADEQLARVSEQFSKIERDAAHDPSVGSGPQLPRGRPARRGLIGLLSAVCIVGIFVAAFVFNGPPDRARCHRVLVVIKATRQVLETEAGTAWKPSNRPA